MRKALTFLASSTIRISTAVTGGRRFEARGRAGPGAGDGGVAIDSVFLGDRRTLLG